MQFHLDGFRPGDPAILPQTDAKPDFTVLPPVVDVLIVGCGPAGLTLAAQLASFPDITTRIVEQKGGPLRVGQADGIACRTVEMFEAFGFAERVLKESYWVNETVFWKPDVLKPDVIVRHGRIDDVEDGLSEFPHVILNQARVHDFYLDIMRNSSTQLEPTYGRRFVDLSVDPTVSADTSSPAVTVRLERLDTAHLGKIETVRARFVVGCDGARSGVRQAMGLTLRGDSANQAWGVMDVLAVTDFPDIRLKSVIQSAQEGSILIIPREGGYMVRIYVELEKLSADERVASRNISLERLIAAAQRILHPYVLEVKEVAWWSVYDIGQRLCDRFDDLSDDQADREPRVFIAGDAGHTHSPKAGLGMNVSMQDGFNLGWKLAAVLRGQSPPDLLRSYSQERHAIARELIEFDRQWARMLSAPLKSPGGAADGVDPAAIQRHFVRHGRYTAGTATRYAPSRLIGKEHHADLARGFSVGMRFHSAPAIRLADAKPVQLGHAARADGRWRIYAFADRADPADSLSPIQRLCAFLEQSPESPLRHHAREGADLDALLDIRAIFQQEHRTLSLGTMPALLLPAKGRFGLRDYEKMFCPDPRRGDIFDMRGIDRDHGCIVVVRPDQYIAQVLPLAAHHTLSAFFNGIMRADRMNSTDLPTPYESNRVEQVAAS